MAFQLPPASTSVSLPASFFDTTGLPIVFNATSSGLTWNYKFATQSTWTAITIGAGTQGAWASSTVVNSGTTSALQGDYELSVPNAAIPQSFGQTVKHILQGGTVSTQTMAKYPFTLIGSNVNASGQVTTTTTFPTNFSTQSIDTLGRIDVGKMLGQAVTLDANNTLNVSAKYWAGGTIPAPNVAGVPLIDAKYFLGTIFATPATAGIPDVNMKNIANAAVSTASSQLGVNVIQVNGSASAASALSFAANDTNNALIVTTTRLAWSGIYNSTASQSLSATTIQSNQTFTAVNTVNNGVTVSIDNATSTHNANIVSINGSTSAASALSFASNDSSNRLIANASAMNWAGIYNASASQNLSHTTISATGTSSDSASIATILANSTNSDVATSTRLAPTSPNRTINVDAGGNVVLQPQQAFDNTGVWNGNLNGNVAGGIGGTSNAFGQTSLLAEQFIYADGDLVGTGGWVALAGSDSPQITEDYSPGSVLFPNSATAGASHAISLITAEPFTIAFNAVLSRGTESPQSFMFEVADNTGGFLKTQLNFADSSLTPTVAITTSNGDLINIPAQTIVTAALKPMKLSFDGQTVSLYYNGTLWGSGSVSFALAAPVLFSLENKSAAAGDSVEITDLQIFTPVVASSGSGTGPYVVTQQVTDGTSNIQSVLVGLSINNTNYSALTGADGIATFGLNATGVYLESAAPTIGMYQNFTPVNRTISGSTTLSVIVLVPSAPPIPGVGQCTGTLVTVDAHGGAEAGVTVWFQAANVPNEAEGVDYDSTIFVETSNSSGVISTLFPSGSVPYQHWRGNSSTATGPKTSFTTAANDGDTFDIPDGIGSP